MIFLSSAAILGDQLLLLLRHTEDGEWLKSSRIEVYDITYDALAAIIVLTSRRQVDLTKLRDADAIELLACPKRDCVFVLAQQRCHGR